MTKTLIMLCGVPGSGKSTWTKWFVSKNYKESNILILSTDDIIEDIAKRHGMTYNEVFGDITYAFAERMMHKLASYAFNHRNLIVWDQTNLTVKSRARKLARVPADWYKVAIPFEVPFDIKERLAARPGKHIPWPIMESMIKNYQKPTLEEGFDSIQTPHFEGK